MLSFFRKVINHHWTLGMEVWSFKKKVSTSLRNQIKDQSKQNKTMIKTNQQKPPIIGMSNVH